MLLPEIVPGAWVLLALSALLIGLSKTALPGSNTIAIAVFAAILPAKQSTGALLVLLIVGDMMALLMYRRHANWQAILRLAPAVVAGLALGIVFLAVADDGGVRRSIGILLLLVVGFTLWRRWVSARSVPAAPAAPAAPAVAAGPGSAGPGSTPASAAPAGLTARIAYGSLAGFTTMVANAAGPVMSMYFLAARFPVKEFLGTAAWFFAIINILKLPFSVGLGLITWSSLSMDLLLVPAVIIGGLCGRLIATRIPQKVFERAVLLLTIVGAVYLIV